MRRHFLPIVITLLSIVITSCSETKIQNPEQIGDKAFAVLQQLDEDNLEDFKSSFVSPEKIREMGESDIVVKSSTTRKEMQSLTDEDYNSVMIRDFNNLKTRGNGFSINWSNIEKLNYDYSKLIESGVEGVSGQLHFKHLETEYTVLVRAIWDGEGYHLSKIQNLFKVFND